MVEHGHRKVAEAALVLFGAMHHEIDRVVLRARGLRRDEFDRALKVEQVEHRRKAASFHVIPRR
jgi:hypothetical protein